MFARAGDALTAGVQAATGRRPRPAPAKGTAGEEAAKQTPPPGEPPPPGDTPRPATSGEEAAARLDAARERLRARIAPPADEDPAPPPE